ncbi:hypothetical protein [Sphingomonas paucimobilis]|uniref:hypothetical protein n=1 Tax=Sphingomonas paucimobilis TaxID=13689 RepID=UPI00242BCC1B|nr:hypothetical protein [Sphingomonas paucimobilis]
MTRAPRPEPSDIAAGTFVAAILIVVIFHINWLSVLVAVLLIGAGSTALVVEHRRKRAAAKEATHA